MVDNYMRIAVTGASGHIGNVVCRILSEKGHQVNAQYHSSIRELDTIPVKPFKGDILNSTDLETLFDGCDAVIHCAAMISIHGDPDGSVYRTNTEGAVKVWNACREKGVKKLIYLSSVHAVMEVPVDEPYNEDRPYKSDGSTAYDLSKAISEQYLLKMADANGPELVIIRPSSAIGPYDAKPSEMGKALIDLYKGKIPVLPQGGYDFVDVRDVAETVVNALFKGRHKEIYLASGKYFLLKDLASLIQEVTGRRMPKTSIPISILKLLLPLVRFHGWLLRAAPQFTRESLEALQNGHPAMDNSKARRELDHQCRAMEVTLRDFYEWITQVDHK